MANHCFTGLKISKYLLSGQAAYFIYKYPTTVSKYPYQINTITYTCNRFSEQLFQFFNSFINNTKRVH